MSRAACAVSLIGWLSLSLLGEARAEEPPTAETAPADDAPGEPRGDTPNPQNPGIDEKTPPRAVSGVARRGRERGDAVREVLDSILWHPRQAVELLFFASAHTAGLIDDEQVIPRVEDTLNPPHGELRVFPTLFVETAGDLSLGMRVLARDRGFGSTVRVGAGGPRDLVAESRLRATLPAPRPLVLGLEMLHDVRGSRGFLGVGQRPEDDPRSHLRADASERVGRYQEVRERFIMSLGTRPLSDVELFISSSLTRRHQRDTVGAGQEAFSRVFDVDALPGGLAARTVVYQEAALRIDTRATRSGASPGFQLETYAGHALTLRPEDVTFIRTGGRIAGYFEVYKRSNVISPRLVLDGMTPVTGSIPWNELTRQPDFRGNDNRRDITSLVASLDYRWTVMRYLAARLFVDAAKVSPDLPKLTEGAPRYAGGLGFDVFTRTGSLGSLTTVVSPEGYNITLNLGVGAGFGDRQHRD
ncbi:MAG: hypothetical protein KIT72_09260 [Polyangiaceae bacterium]|nr:hypothetical protein [Polyangiaceae bacterium]MCW5790597.1 hypothetical protein [Polyangiaceae bacterium]